jgi:thiol-disulfide isomerase/thioredoxin
MHMALEFTKPLTLGYPAPEFNLPEPLTGKWYQLSDLKGANATVVMFICNHCPYVKHINQALIEVANLFIPQGVRFIAINSNDAVAYPADGPDEMARTAKELGYPFVYLYDESQQVAKAYHAVCTPDISVFDAGLKCVYRGQFDSSRPNSGIPVTGSSLTTVPEHIIKGHAVPTQQIPSAGCSIKWKH